MHAHVVIRAPDGQAHELVPGDVIGRLFTAALYIDDGRVSEAHAMISLRDGALRLLPLRGAFAVGGKPLEQVILSPGQCIQLARGVELLVEAVALPAEVLGIEAPGLPLRALPGVASVSTVPRCRVVRGWDERAAARVWNTGEGWRLQSPGSEPRPIHPGDEVELDGVRVAFRAIPIAGAGQSDTRRGDGLAAPLHLVAHYETAHVQRHGRVVLKLSGILARIVSELVSFGGPVSWTVLAGELWPSEPDGVVLRGRLDANLSRLRRKLRAAGVRTDLVRTDGAGQIEVLLYPHDTVEDRT